MSRFWSCLLLGLALISGAGCSTPMTPEQKATNNQFNQHWRDGGGFNNPNPERVKKGLPALNFDGSDPRDDWKPKVNLFESEFAEAINARIQKCMVRWFESLPSSHPIETAGPPNP